MYSIVHVYLFMKLSNEAGVLWMEWIFLFTLSSKDDVAALSNFMSLETGKQALLDKNYTRLDITLWKQKTKTNKQTIMLDLYFKMPKRLSCDIKHRQTCWMKKREKHVGWKRERDRERDRQTYWIKPAWRSCLEFCSRCFSCSSCFLYLLTLFSLSSSLFLAWSIISFLLCSSSSAESFLQEKHDNTNAD